MLPKINILKKSTLFTRLMKSSRFLLKFSGFSDTRFGGSFFAQPTLPLQQTPQELGRRQKTKRQLLEGFLRSWVFVPLCFLAGARKRLYLGPSCTAIPDPDGKFLDAVFGMLLRIDLLPALQEPDPVPLKPPAQVWEPDPVPPEPPAQGPLLSEGEWGGLRGGVTRNYPPPCHS